MQGQLDLQPEICNRARLEIDDRFLDIANDALCRLQCRSLSVEAALALSGTHPTIVCPHDSGWVVLSPMKLREGVDLMRSSMRIADAARISGPFALCISHDLV